MNAKPGKTIYKGLKNILVYGNNIEANIKPRSSEKWDFLQRARFRWPGWKPRWDDDDEIIGGHSPPTKDCIFLTDGNLTQHHVYEDNVYYGTTQRMGIEHRRGTPTYETGNISSTMIAPYQNMSLPKYNIPTYACMSKSNDNCNFVPYTFLRMMMNLKNIFWTAKVMYFKEMLGCGFSRINISLD